MNQYYVVEIFWGE